MAEGAEALQVFIVGEEADFYEDGGGVGLPEDGERGEVEVVVGAGLYFVGSAWHDWAES